MKYAVLAAGVVIVGVIAWLQKDQQNARHRLWVQDQERRERGQGIEQSTWRTWPYDRGNDENEAA